MLKSHFQIFSAKISSNFGQKQLIILHYLSKKKKKKKLKENIKYVSATPAEQGFFFSWNKQH